MKKPTFLKRINAAMTAFKNLGSPIPYKNFMWGNSPLFLTQDQDSYVKDGYQTNLIVYAAINKIIKSVSSLPIILYEVKDEKKAKRYKSYNPLSLKAMQIKSVAFEEVTSHKIIDILERPNPNMPLSDFIENAIGYKMITGNRYIYGASADSGLNKGLAQELYVLPSQLIQIETDPSGLPINYKWIGAPNKKMEAEKILHQKYFNPDFGSHPYGMSPIQACRYAVTHSNDSYQASVSLLQNVGAIGLVSGSETQYQQGFTDEQAKMLKDKLKAKRGVDNYGDIEVTSLPITWTQLGMNAVDLAIIEQNKMSKRDICMIYGVPSVLLGDTENSTYNNVETAMKALYTQAALPELYNLIDGLNNWFVKPWGEKEGKQYYLECDISGIKELQDDFTQIVNQMANSWWIKPNEKRLAMGYGEDMDTEEMNMYWVPTGYMPVSDIYFTDATEKLFTSYGVSTKSGQAGK